MCVHKRIHWMGRAMWMVTAGLMIAGLIAAQAAHSQTFTIGQNGKNVGTATLSIKQVPGGFDFNSETRITMSGLNYSFAAAQALDPTYRLQNVELTGQVNGVSATVNTAIQGQGFQVRINANGKQSQTPLAYHDFAIFWPDFDPGALQVLLSLSAANNNRDLWALVPKQTGSAVPLKIVVNADEQGSLSGKLLIVHHLTVSMETTSVEVFAGPANELLQAEWTDEGFAMARQNFKLTPPARPRSTPPAPQQQPHAARQQAPDAQQQAPASPPQR